MRNVYLLPIFIIYFLSTAFLVSAQQPETSQALSFKQLVFSADTFSDTVSSELVSSWIQFTPVLEKNSQIKSEIENISYCASKPIICELTTTQRQKYYLRKTSTSTVQREKIQAYVEDVARKANRDPIDAKFKIQDGKVAMFEQSQNGLEIDVEKSVKKIEEFLLQPLQAFEDSKKLELSFSTTNPKITSSEVNNMGISTLIGEGRSNFKGSPANRIKNIRVATQRFDGVLIKPNEEFSFVKILGEVDEDHGYFPELVIKNNKTEPEFGGGVCQVSTTAFRAAINTGMKITARKNHAYPVSYYNPQGMDSTIYVPRPDLKFINNTPAYILIQTQIVGTELIFQFYGTSDGRSVEVIGPKIIEQKPDGALKTTFTQKVTSADGSTFIEDVFNSSYLSPHKFPHTGSPLLKSKPSNWSEEEWTAYKKAWREANPSSKKD